MRFTLIWEEPQRVTLLWDGACTVTKVWLQELAIYWGSCDVMCVLPFSCSSTPLLLNAPYSHSICFLTFCSLKSLHAHDFKQSLFNFRSFPRIKFSSICPCCFPVASDKVKQALTQWFLQWPPGLTSTRCSVVQVLLPKGRWLSITSELRWSSESLERTQAGVGAGSLWGELWVRQEP